ncbi:MAG: chemotaxis protein CheA [Deltaproteobacteria bacterium]|nr:chemotaxis protein CheA [Deltaproteobacteria bacterium]
MNSHGVRDEFFQEAQELIDTLAKDLLALEMATRGGSEEPELINDVFRSVHTLKGLSGLFSLDRLARLSHVLEDRLDDLRMGRLPVTPSTLDALFRAIELLGRMLASARRGGSDNDPELESLMVSLNPQAAAPAVVAVDELFELDIDPDIVRVLTEMEEHRLRTNVRNGTPMYRLRARLPIDRIDRAIDELKQRARPLGELIAYFPTGDLPADATLFELDILFASSSPFEQLQSRLESGDLSIHRIARRGHSQTVMPVASAPSVEEPSIPQKLARSEVPNVPAPLLTQRVEPMQLDSPFADQSPTGENRSLERTNGGKTPVPPKPEEERASSHSSRAVHSVRVDIRRLDHLMNVLSELAIVRGALSRMSERVRQRPELREFSGELHRLHRTFDRNLAEMQSGILEVRMVPLGQVFDRLARGVRQVARQHNKEIRLVVTGADTEVDKLIVEELSDPLLHIVRNSIDHGIETQPDRLAYGKPVEGTIALNAFQAGNHVIIEIEDDGAGIDPERVIATAVRRGLIGASEAEAYSTQDAINLLFLPGFSTRTEVTDLSGRGVGLDVVKTNIGRLGGVVDVQSERGIGTKFTITLPISLAILRALLIGVAGRTYALPLSSVAEATLLDPRALRTVEGREVVSLRGETLPICRLDRLFGHAEVNDGSRHASRHFVVVIALGGRRIGMVVSELFGQQDIVIKALGPSLAGVRGFAGATDLGDQRVGLVIDAAALLDELLSANERRGLEGGRVGRYTA